MSRYVAVEGIDGAGKSTIAAALAEELRARGLDVTLVREPGGTAAGEAIREILLGGTPLDHWTEALLFAAARAELAATVVRPALERGSTVVSDRSYFSSLAYQGAARGLGVDVVRGVNEAGLRGVVPDVVILLRIDAAEAVEREDDADRISAEGVEFQRRVAAAYEELAEANPEWFLVVDVAAPVADIVGSLADTLEQRW